MANQVFHCSAALVAFMTALASTPAMAGEVRGYGMNRFEPSSPSSRWFTLESLDDSGMLTPSAKIVGDFNHAPQKLYAIDGTHHTLVDHQLALHLGASLVWKERFRLGLSLPLYVSQKGETVERFDGTYVGPKGAGIGDLRIGAEARIVGDPSVPFRLGVAFRFWAPTGSPEKYTGDGKYKLEPRVDAAGELGLFEYAASVGYLRRGRHKTYVLTPIGDEISFGVAGGIRLLDDALLLGPELRAAVAVSDTGEIYEKNTLFASLLVGGHYRLSDLNFGLAAGPGLSHAAGTPKFRALASVEWAPR